MFSPPPVTRWHRRYFCCYCFRWCRCCSAINGVRRLGAVIAALFLNLMPITAVLITAALGVEPTRQQLIGGGLVRHPAGPVAVAMALG